MVDKLVERLEEKAAFLNADCDCGRCQQCVDGLLLCEAANALRLATPANGEQVERLEAEVQRLRGLLIDPGSPAWEDARAVLAAELRKAEMPNHARAVENAEGPYIPSHIALNLIAHARSATPTEDARERVKVLEEAAKVADAEAAIAKQSVFDLAGDDVAQAVASGRYLAAMSIAQSIRAFGNKETDRHG